MTTRGSRYYSQNYSLVDNPENAQHPVPQTHSRRQQQEEDYGEYDSYQGFQKVADLNVSSAAALPRRHRREPERRRGWSTRRKVIVIGGAVLVVLILALGIGLGVGLSHSGGDSWTGYTPSDATVTNQTSFDTGAATKDVYNNDDGIGSGKDEYTYYSGDSSQFPNSSDWISFNNLWSGNLHMIQNSCKLNHHGKNNSPSMIQSIFDAIQNRAAVSFVDHRFILAIILQESAGCARVKSTDNGIANPGIMQSHNGSEFNAKHSNESIYLMVQDGTQGTESGDGLVQNLNYYGTAYRAARGYNSGYIPANGNLSEAAGATACYVSDVANRLTGWSNATSTCPGDQ